MNFMVICVEHEKSFITSGHVYLSQMLIGELIVYEPRSEKTGLRGFRPDLTQTGLYNHRRWLEV